MRQYTDLEYLSLSKGAKFTYRLQKFFASIPVGLKNAGIGIGKGIAKAGRGIGNECSDLVTTFTRGDWKTKVSYLHDKEKHQKKNRKDKHKLHGNLSCFF